MLRELPTKSPLPVKDAKLSEIDFFDGEFWQIPLGQAVKSFIETEVVDKGMSFPISTAQTSTLLKLRQEGRSSYFIAGLCKSGLLADVERDAERHYMLKPDHVIINGLALLHLERGYPLDQIREELVSLFEGTSLLSSVGNVDSKLYSCRTHNIFAKDSPWLQFPLESTQSQDTSIKSSKQKLDNRLGDDLNSPIVNPKNKWIPKDERLLIIPKIHPELIIYFKDKFGLLFQKLNNISNDAEARDYLPFEVVQSIMFIFAAHNRDLSSYDPESEFYTVSDLRVGVMACWEEWNKLEKEQKITSLFQLFQVVEWKVRNNTDRYWNSGKAVVK